MPRRTGLDPVEWERNAGVFETPGGIQFERANAAGDVVVRVGTQEHVIRGADWIRIVSCVSFRGSTPSSSDTLSAFGEANHVHNHQPSDNTQPEPVPNPRA